MKKNESSKASELTNNEAEIDKEDEKKARGESKTSRPRVLYEVDATNLKMADRNRRILGSSIMISAELAFIFIVSIFMQTSELMIFGLIILFVAIMFILPQPIVLTPSKYKITKQGIVLNGQKVFPLRKNYKLQMNPNRNFISVRDRKGEVIKLYTTESEKVMKILNKLITSEKTTK